MSPFVGYSLWAHDAIVEDDVTYGGSLGYNFSENFGIEVSYNTIDSKIVPEGVTITGADPDGPGPEQGEVTVIAPGGIDVTGDQFRLEGLFYIYPGKKLAPYAVLGVGHLTYDYGDMSYEKTNIPLGFGCKYFVTDMIAIRADFRDVYKLPDNNLLLTIGVTFQFGGN